MKRVRILGKKSIVLIMMLCVAMLVRFSVPSVQTQLTWRIEEIGKWATDIAVYNSLALDSFDNPHISYWDNTLFARDLKHKWWDGTGWVTTNVDQDADVGRFSSIALDSNNYPHITYLNYTSGQLKYAWWDGTTWHKEIIGVAGTAGLSGGDSSIALDSNDNPHISWCNRIYMDLWYATWDGATWRKEVVEGEFREVGEYNSLALDSNDRPHISYYDFNGKNLRYAWWDGATWVKEDVDTPGNVGWYTSLALDSGDNPHISYFDFSQTRLKYANRTGGTWDYEPVDSAGDVGRFSSLALNSGDNPHISYFEIDPFVLKHASRIGSAWSVDEVDPLEDFTGTDYYSKVYSSIALDSGDYPHIVYADLYWWEGTFNWYLKYATTAPANQLPVADANGPYAGTKGQPITFDGSGSYDPDGSIISYEWDFGDGNQSTSVNPTHTYAAVGTYPVSLTVRDNRNALDTDSTTAEVTYHEVAVVDVVPSKTVVGRGYNMSVDVTVENGGAHTETFEIILYTGPNPTPAQWETFWSMGDVNRDGYINGTDSILILDAYGSYPGHKKWNPDADLNQDLIVDLLDVATCASNSGLNIWTYFCTITDAQWEAFWSMGDVNRNGYINNADGNLITDAMGSTFGSPNWNPDADLSQNDVVDSTDFLIWAANSGLDIWTYLSFDGKRLQTQPVIDLAAGAFTTLTFTLVTTGVPYGYYTMCAYASPVWYEVDKTNNTLAFGPVMVTIPGDVNGDRTVDIFDIGYISAHWYPGPPIGPSGYDPNCDINSDGAVDIFDVGITSAHWGESW